MNTTSPAAHSMGPVTTALASAIMARMTGLAKGMAAICWMITRRLPRSQPIAMAVMLVTYSASCTTTASAAPTACHSASSARGPGMGMGRPLSFSVGLMQASGRAATPALSVRPGSLAAAHVTL